MAASKRYVGYEVTLDGKPAIVAGSMNPFASVAQIPRGLIVEFAWETITHVIEQHEGHFKS